MPDAAGTLTARSPWSRGASSLTGLPRDGGDACNAECVPRVREAAERGEPSAPRAEAAVAAIFLRFVRTGTTHSGDGNGCGNGRWSLSFHACGSRAVIRGDEQGKVPMWPARVQGHRGACAQRPGLPAACNLARAQIIALCFLISLPLFFSRVQCLLRRETAKGLCSSPTASTVLSHCHHYRIRKCQLGNCSVAVLKFFREVSLPLILDPSILTQ